MKQLPRFAFIFLAIISVNYANAQFNGNEKKWSINDCFKYAEEHNIQVSTLRLNEQSSLQDLMASRAEKIPNLSATVGNTFNNANNQVDGNGKLLNQLTNSGNYTLNSSLILWNGNYINNTIRQRELLSQSARLSINESINNITLLITQAYLDILLAKENLTYINDLVNASAARVSQGQMFYEAGSIAKKDLLQLQAQLASDKYLLVQTQNAIRQNILILKQILQLPTSAEFDIATPDSVSVAPQLIPLSEVQQAAQREFPEIKISQLDVNIASLDIARAKAGFKPVLSANAALGSGYSDVFTNSVLPKTNLFIQTGNNFYQRLGWTLSIPIFSNRINQTNLEKANIGFRVANLNLQNTELILSQAVEQAYLNAENAMHSYDAAKQQLAFATESYRIENEQFKLGGTNTYDLLQQRNQYIQAVQAFTQAKYSAVLQQKIYEFYMGKPVTL
ncbi:MAG: TolC family protein [Bacteroidota bacterium]|nr:TolC family protein [Bacteroidota bacterium]